MLRIIKSTVFIVLSFLFSYFGMNLMTDPAEIISKYDIPKDYIVSEININNSEKVFLKAGNEKFGLSHILKRHSKHYFKEENNKGKLFPEGTNGLQIIKGIENVCSLGQIENKKGSDKTIYQNELVMNGEKGKYRLVLNNKNEVITFYKIKS